VKIRRTGFPVRDPPVGLADLTVEQFAAVDFDAGPEAFHEVVDLIELHGLSSDLAIELLTAKGLQLRSDWPTTRYFSGASQQDLCDANDHAQREPQSWAQLPGPDDRLRTTVETMLLDGSLRRILHFTKPLYSLDREIQNRKVEFAQLSLIRRLFLRLFVLTRTTWEATHLILFYSQQDHLVARSVYEQVDGKQSKPVHKYRRS
jgi:hypothetical protein